MMLLQIWCSGCKCIYSLFLHQHIFGSFRLKIPETKFLQILDVVVIFAAFCGKYSYAIWFLSVQQIARTAEAWNETKNYSNVKRTKPQKPHRPKKLSIGANPTNTTAICSWKAVTENILVATLISKFLGGVFEFFEPRIFISTIFVSQSTGKNQDVRLLKTRYYRRVIESDYGRNIR